MTTRDLHELVVEEVTVTWRNDRPPLLHAAYHLSLAFYRIGRPSSHIESYKLHVHLSLAGFALKILAFERGECIVCDNGHSLQLIQDGWPQLQMQVDVHPSPMIDDTVACAGPGECAIGGLQGAYRALADVLATLSSYLQIASRTRKATAARRLGDLRAVFPTAVAGCLRVGRFLACLPPPAKGSRSSGSIQAASFTEVPTITRRTHCPRLLERIAADSEARLSTLQHNARRLPLLSRSPLREPKHLAAATRSLLNWEARAWSSARIASAAASGKRTPIHEGEYLSCRHCLCQYNRRSHRHRHCLQRCNVVALVGCVVAAPERVVARTCL